MEKYKELYDLSKEALTEEQNRFSRLDEKASKYLSIFTLLIGGLGFFGSWLINEYVPPKGYLEWIILSLGLVFFISIIFAWNYIFNVLRLSGVKKIPLNSEVIEFFDKHRLLDIYYSLARGIKDALEFNRNIAKEKEKKLAKAYNSILIAGISLLFLIGSLIIYKWNEPRINNNGGQIMATEDNDKKKSSSEKPNPEIKPPTFPTVNEDASPTILKDIKKKKK